MGIQIPDDSLLTNLLSGLIGSLVGAFIGARSTLKAAKISLDGLYKQEKEKRLFESRQQNLAVVHALIKELKENLSIAQELPNKSFKHVVMSREAWSIYKGNTSFLPQKLQADLPYTYTLIAEYNSILDYDKFSQVHGEGRNNDKIAGAADKFKGNVGSIINKLEDVLRELSRKD
ncbi:MAG: hypothetical protein AAB599_01445 [Patescibacteria group bacterium]